MLYYLVIYFFIVGSFAEEVLQPDGPKGGYPLEVPEGPVEGFGSFLEMPKTPKNTSSFISNLIGGNASASTLLSQLVNVNPKDVGKVIVLVEDLIKKGNQEIATLDTNYANAAKDVKTGTAKENKAQLLVDRKKSDVNKKKKALSVAKSALKSAENAQIATKKALNAAKRHHKALKDRYKHDRGVLENQVKILHQVLTLLVPIGPKLTRNKVYQIIKKIYKTFDVSFDLYINSYGGGKWLSVFHMTTGRNHGTIGSRIPAVWVNGPGKYLAVSNGVNGNTNYWKNYPVKLKTWYHVQIKQVENKAKKIVYTILVNNKVVSSLVNTKPREYKNVKAFVADPWHPALNGHIKNIQIITP